MSQYSQGVSTRSALSSNQHQYRLHKLNTVFVADNNHRVSVYTSSGQFIECFGTQGSGEGVLNYPEGVAVDKTTGALYVCEYSSDRVVVY